MRFQRQVGELKKHRHFPYGSHITVKGYEKIQQINKIMAECVVLRRGQTGA